MNIKLSICIPTYNRAHCLAAALDSIISQATGEVEIVVSDNASTDNTAELVRSYQTRFDRITYHCNATNLGADRNFLKVVELAQGEYCWLLGSDDALASFAVATLMPLLGNADVYLSDIKTMSLDMNKTLDSHYSMLSDSGAKIYDCSDYNELARYLNDVKDISSLFGFISAIIVRRSAWQAQPDIEEIIGSAWIHASKIFQMMRSGAIVQHINIPIVLNRCGNDSFLATVGYTRRRLIDLDFSRIAKVVFLNQPEIQQVVTNTVAKKYFSLRVILSDKRSSLILDDPIANQQLLVAYKRYFSNQPYFFTKIFIWTVIPLQLLMLLRFIFKKR